MGAALPQQGWSIGERKKPDFLFLVNRFEHYVQRQPIHKGFNIILSLINQPCLATGEADSSTKLWDKDGNQLGQFEGDSPTLSPDWQTIAIVTQPSYFGASLDSENSVVKLYRIDLNLDSPLRRACQRLKSYILDDPNQTNEQKQRETQLGESWQAQRTSKWGGVENAVQKRR